MRGSYRGRKALGGLFLFALVVGAESFAAPRGHGVACEKASAGRAKAMCFRAKNGNEEEESFKEPMATSPLNYGKYDGEFTCAYCGEVLFDSNAKYDSGSGWPSFWRSAGEGSMEYKLEFDNRLECRCKKCSSHLGHVFLDGPTPGQVDQDVLNTSPESDPRSTSGKYLPRFCVNGAALQFKSRDSD